MSSLNPAHNRGNTGYATRSTSRGSPAHTSILREKRSSVLRAAQHAPASRTTWARVISVQSQGPAFSTRVPSAASSSYVSYGAPRTSSAHTCAYIQLEECAAENSSQRECTHGQHTNIVMNGRTQQQRAAPCPIPWAQRTDAHHLSHTRDVAAAPSITCTHCGQTQCE